MAEHAGYITDAPEAVREFYANESYAADVEDGEGSFLTGDPSSSAGAKTREIPLLYRQTP